MGVGVWEVQEEGDIRIHICIADSLHCIAEDSTTM